MQLPGWRLSYLTTVSNNRFRVRAVQGEKVQAARVSNSTQGLRSFMPHHCMLPLISQDFPVCCHDHKLELKQMVQQASARITIRMGIMNVDDQDVLLCSVHTILKRQLTAHRSAVGCFRQNADFLNGTCYEAHRPIHDVLDFQVLCTSQSAWRLE